MCVCVCVCNVGHLPVELFLIIDSPLKGGDSRKLSEGTSGGKTWCWQWESHCKVPTHHNACDCMYSGDILYYCGHMLADHIT